MNIPQTFKIEFLKPAIVEGREYLPFSHANPDRCTLLTCTGRARIFRSLGTAVAFATECFGPGYRDTLRIYRSR